VTSADVSHSALSMLRPASPPRPLLFPPIPLALARSVCATSSHPARVHSAFTGSNNVLSLSGGCLAHLWKAPSTLRCSGESGKVEVRRNVESRRQRGQWNGLRLRLRLRLRLWLLLRLRRRRRALSLLLRGLCLHLLQRLLSRLDGLLLHLRCHLRRHLHRLRRLLLYGLLLLHQRLWMQLHLLVLHAGCRKLPRTPHQMAFPQQ